MTRIVEKYHLESGVQCQLLQIKNDLIPNDYLLCFPKLAGEPSEDDVSEMLSLGIKYAREISQESLGDSEAYSVLYSGYAPAERKAGISILCCWVIAGEKLGFTMYWP